jgi:hypothetical protein
MKLVLVLCLAIGLSHEAWAQKQLNAQTFQINVRPSLNAILSDFYNMLGMFPSFPRELVTIVNQLEALNLEKEALRVSCPRLLDKKCMSTIRKLRTKLSLVQAKTMELMARHRDLPTLHLSSIAGQRMLMKFQNDLALLKGELDNVSFLHRARLPFEKKTFEVIGQLDQLTTLATISVVEFIPFTYKEDFRHFYFNFVNPIQLHISKNMNYEFLNRNVNSLNFSLNLLVMNLTKRNKRTPEGMTPYLNLIHNRWNSVLRHYL